METVRNRFSSGDTLNDYENFVTILMEAAVGRVHTS